MTTALTTKTNDVRDLLRSEKILEQVKLALPQHLTPERMVRVMCTSMLRNPKLLDCRQESLVEALMICSQAGIEPDGRNAHLIPYGDKVQVIFDYKGLVAIAERNGVESIYADKVCDNDQFDAWVEEGVKKLKHKVDWRKPRGNEYAYYASCIRSGRLDYEVMTKDEVDAIRKRSKAAGSGPWVTDYAEMAKKTVLRRMSKRWDLSPEVREAMTSDSDVPEFEMSIPAVKTPNFPEPPQLAAPTPPTPRKRAAKTTTLVEGPLETKPNPMAGVPVSANMGEVTIIEPQPEPPDDLPFETVVDGERPEIVALREEIKTAATRLNITIEECEKRFLSVCEQKKLFAEGADKTLTGIRSDKFDAILKNFKSTAMDKYLSAA